MSSNFAHKWEKERNSGFLRYYIRHLLGMMFIFLGMNLGDYFANKKISGLFVIISLIVSLLFPVLAWIINQARYNKHARKYNK